PYMEQDNLFKFYSNFGGLDYTGYRYNGGPSGCVLGDPRGCNRAVTAARLKSFTCPSDTQQSKGVTTEHNYVLNVGNTSFFQTPTPIGCTVGKPGCTPFLGAPFGYYNGVTIESSGFGWDSTLPWGPGAPGDKGPPGPDINKGLMGAQFTITSISDGTSNTLM